MGVRRAGKASERGARKAEAAILNQDVTPVHRGQQLDERQRPVSVKRKKVGPDVRVDQTRVSGPIRVVLEPLLWVSFLTGVVWLLIALDPGLREPQDGVIIYEYTLPLAILVGSVVVIATVTALMWLPSATSATRARSTFAGLGMLASGWLFAKLHPVEAQDFQGLSWLCIAIGVLLVAMCSVPWPTQRSSETAEMGPWSRLLVAALGLVAVGVVVIAWEAARVGLVGVRPDARTGWDNLLPVLGVLVLLLAAIRAVLRRPAREYATYGADAG